MCNRGLRWSRGSCDVEPRLQWRGRGGNRGVLDGHEPELGGNLALKLEPNYDMVDSSSRRVETCLEPRDLRSSRSGPFEPKADLVLPQPVQDEVDKGGQEAVCNDQDDA